MSWDVNALNIWGKNTMLWTIIICNPVLENQVCDFLFIDNDIKNQFK